LRLKGFRAAQIGSLATRKTSKFIGLSDETEREHEVKVAGKSH
jgi:hypothetical protein